jgi:hypothetical protein
MDYFLKNQLAQIDQQLRLLNVSDLLDKTEFYDRLKNNEQQGAGALEQVYIEQAEKIEALEESVGHLAMIVENMHHTLAQLTASHPYYDTSKSHLLPEIKSKHGVY